MAKAAKLVEHGEKPEKRVANLNKRNLPARLLKWYDQSRRVMPWRALPGKMPNPYHVWLSEIMLQQTVVKTVIPYFQKFISLWPTIDELANAEIEDIRRAWAGLGYYSRAKNLHKCAQMIVNEYEGQFPIFAEELEQLPGIGPYTAAAIAAIAFDERATPLDGNIERVITRVFAIEDPLPTSKPLLKKNAENLTPAARCGDYAQALMDLGATVCMPKKPSCLLCPISGFCEGYQKGIAPLLPYRVAKKPKPTRYGTAFFALREDGKILLRQRREGGLLGGMMEIPGSEWQINQEKTKEDLKSPPVSGKWLKLDGAVTHTFTHFHLELTVYQLLVPKKANLTLFADAERCRWVERKEIKDQALPTVMRKIVEHAIGDLGQLEDEE